jgi:hypothetical protein
MTGVDTAVELLETSGGVAKSFEFVECLTALRRGVEQMCSSQAQEFHDNS